MPTFFLYKNGKKIQEIVGANPPGIQKSITAAAAEYAAEVAARKAAKPTPESASEPTSQP